jgi:hypothetical protein
MIGIINASPLIYLSKIGALDHLHNLFDHLITSSIVKNEVLIEDDASEHVILQNAFDSWIEIMDDYDETTLHQLMQLEIHAGEASVILLAHQYQILAQADVWTLLDDNIARQVALSMNLEIIGTVGILIRLAAKDLISSDKASAYLHSLIESTNFPISSKTFGEALTELEKLKK